ncbi:MAG TPA: DNA polymerase IV [Steroidobacteraceae bacterium]|jgi:DNA polymerase-4|nr:DNA polymerase IV [Steroidobacteraceae bacterium]
MSTLPSPPIRRIAHLDMDAFYASVELLRYPQLRGQPVVIGGGWRRDLGPDAARREFLRLRDYVGRGVVTTATYPARDFGVHSAMGLMKAAQLCPQAFLLPVDFDEYRRFSRRFKAVIARFAPVIEDRGVDEVYIDFTQAGDAQHDGGRTLALQIQRAIHEETGLSCSIGVAPNKLIAKMASEFLKPNGVSIVYESELIQKIWPLPCRKINGIGPKAGAQLEQLGIRTIGELARCERSWLAQHFGPNQGGWMYDCAWGRDDREVVTQSEPVSMSRETTFERDLHAVRDRAELGVVFTDLCERVAQDLQRHAYVGKTIGIKLRYDNFQRSTREQTLEFYTSDPVTIRRTAGLCLKRAPLERRLRLLGVKVAGLVKNDSLEARTYAAARPPAAMPLF